MKEESLKGNQETFKSLLNPLHKDNDDYLNRLLNIEEALKIKAFGDLKSFFSEVKFSNNAIEQLYQEENEKILFLYESQNNLKEDSNNAYNESLNSPSLSSDLIINLVFILSYIVSLVYLLIPYFNPLLLAFCIICKLITCVIVYINYKLKKNKDYKNNKKLFIYIDHILIFISSFNFNVKVILISVLYNSVTNDNSEELIRVIIYQFVSTNMYLIIKLEASVKISLFYFLKDFACIIIAHSFSYKNHYYFLDGISSFATYLVFYIFRKIWDLRLRSHFSEKLKFKDFFFYVSDLINGLKGYHFNIFDEKYVSFNDKFSDFIKKNQDENKYLNKLIKTYITFFEDDSNMNLSQNNNIIVQSNDFNKIDNNKKLDNNSEVKKNKLKKISVKKFISKLKNEYNLYSLNENTFNSHRLNKNNFNFKNYINNEELNLNNFLHNLILYNINTKTIQNNEEQSILMSNSDDTDKLNSSNDKVEENLKDDEESLFDIINKNIKNNIIGEAFRINLNESNQCDSVKCLGVFHIKKNSTFLVEKIKKYFINIYGNETYKNEKFNKENSLLNNQLNFEENNFIRDENLEESKQLMNIQHKIYPLKKNSKQELIKNNSLKDKYFFKNIQSITLQKSDSELEIYKKLTAIEKLLSKREEHISQDIYFEIFMRRVRFTNGRIIYNLIFYDVTDLINSKNNLLKEDFQKTRIFAKIAHEFKTPLNSILSILYKISEEINIIPDKNADSIVKNNMNNKLANAIDILKLDIEDFNINLTNSSTFKKSRSFDKLCLSGSRQINSNNSKNSFYNENIQINQKMINSINLKEQIFLAYDLLNSINFLVSDIITLSNLNNLNHLNIRNDFLNLKEIITTINKMLQTLIYLSKTKQKQIKTEIIIDPSIKFDLEHQELIKSDDFKLKQILFNFITNAVKFTTKGKISIEINIKNSFISDDLIFINKTGEDLYSLKSDYNLQQNTPMSNSDYNKRYLCISIIDTGIGIHPDNQKNIFNSNFENDYKNNKNIKDIFRIKGFGLMLCKSLAKIMNIGIGFSSQVNIGSKFFIMIPFRDKKEVYEAALIRDKNKIETTDSKLHINYIRTNSLDNQNINLIIPSNKKNNNLNNKDLNIQKSSKFQNEINNFQKVWDHSKLVSYKTFIFTKKNRGSFDITKISKNSPKNSTDFIIENENDVYKIDHEKINDSINSSNLSHGKKNNVIKLYYIPKFSYNFIFIHRVMPK